MNAKTVIILLCLCIPLRTTAQSADSLQVDKTTRFKATQLIIPGTLIAASTFGLWNDWTRSANISVRDKMADIRNGRYIRVDDYLQYLPVVSYVGLGAIGARTKHNFKERLLVTGTSYLSMGIMVNAVKYSVKEMRPDNSKRNSYPSGHTATAFMGAELVRTEYGTGYGVAAYTVACGIAFLRLYNNRHWTTDVLAGAGIGILSARIGYWMLPVTRRWFGMERNRIKTADVAITTAPFYDCDTHAVGGSLALVF